MARELNSALDRQLEKIYETLRPILMEAGEAVVARLDNDMYLNGVRIPVNTANFRFHQTVLEAFARRGVAGLRIQGGLESDELCRTAAQACWPMIRGYSARDLGPGSSALEPSSSEPKAVPGSVTDAPGCSRVYRVTAQSNRTPGPGGQLGGSAGAAFGGPAGQHDIRAGLGQRGGDGQAEAGRTAGDHGDLPGPGKPPCRRRVGRPAYLWGIRHGWSWLPRLRNALTRVLTGIPA